MKGAGMSIAEVKDLSKIFGRGSQKIEAVSHVSLQVKEGEILGVVGESGCGKSTLGKLMLRLLQPSDGSIIFRGQDITRASYNDMRKIRKDMQMIFQGSSNAFNPFFNVRQILSEPLSNYPECIQGSINDQMERALEEVGLNSEYLDRYSRELSGGQRQRVGIARALMLDPKFVVCDEAVSSIDYALKNQILRILYRLKQEHGSTYLFISHDIEAVRAVCDRVAVMYLGKLVELLPDTYTEGIHPYTQALLSAALSTDPTQRSKRKLLFKENNDKERIERGCPFQNRCLYAIGECFESEPDLKEVQPGHFSACHLHK